ncbi:glutamate-rich protein 3 isoform X2 [Heliangelus exortis]|uniref:glutamate-rich protein 3 isoform X2 n=1 Tax=Heliangelus exortis TaxID=472823 RepID=UPI003A8D7991
MSGPQPGFLATYNSLTDKHLAGYFSNARIRRHLQRSGLISRSGRIIPDKEYRLNAMRREHQQYVQECLARAIFHKVLDMERHHQLEIKRKLENSVRRERVQKIKVEQSRRWVEGASPMHSPHPPPGPRSRHGLHPLVPAGPAGCSQLRAAGPVADDSGGHPAHQHRFKGPALPKMTSWRPSTAPGSTQHPLRLQPIHSCPAGVSVPKASSSKHKCHALENGQQFASGGERSGLRLMNSVEYVTGISPYQLPIISNYVIPAPPPPLHRGDKSTSAVRSRVPRGRRFRPTTAPNGLEQLLTKNSGGPPKPSLRSNAFVTMVFRGKSVHLSHDDDDYRDEIKVYQQHCGGENLCVYKGKLLEGETFQFVSKRHHGFPFSLTFFLNGIQVDRLSCCCEYKHQKRSRLGGRHGYFAFLSVEGASPCYRCIIAMGLDKKPYPPKRKIKEHEEEHVGSWRDGEHSEPSESNVEQKPRKESVLVILPIHEVSVETIEDTAGTGQEYTKEERENLSDHKSEDSQEDTSKNEYDEDFEADEDTNEDGQAGDQMNGMSKSFSDDKKLNLGYEKESTNSSQNVLPTSDSEEDESAGYSDSDSEDDKQDRPAHSLSSSSAQYSSEDESHDETVKDNVVGKEEYNSKRASDNTAHAQNGNKNREKKLLRMEEIQETFALEKEGIDEAEKVEPEDLTAREDSGIFHENILAVQHPSPEGTGKPQQAGSAEGNVGEDGEKNASTRRDSRAGSLAGPLESSLTDVEDKSEESPQSSRGGAPDGASLAEGSGTLDVQKATKQVVQEGQMVGERQALEKKDSAAEGEDACSEEAGGEMAQVGDLLPREDMGSVLQAEGQLVVEEPTPEESTVSEGDSQGEGTGKGTETGTVVAPGEQEVLMEGRERETVLGESALGGEEPAGTLGSREAGGAMSEWDKVVGEVSKGEEAAEEASKAEGAEGDMGALVEEVVGETVSKGKEAMEEGGSTRKGIVISGMVSEVEEAVEEGGSLGKGVVAGAVSGEEEAVEEGGSSGKGTVMGEVVSEAEEAMEEEGSSGKGIVAGVVSGEEEVVEDVKLAEERIAGIVGPEEAVDEGSSVGEEAVEKPGALPEALGDRSACTGEAMPGGKDFVKPHEFSLLKASGEEQMETGKTAVETATSEAGEVSEVEGSSLLGAEDRVEESVEPGEGPVLQEASGLEALVDAGSEPVSEGTSQLEVTTAVEEKEEEEEEEGSAALPSPNPSECSQAKAESAMEGGGVRGVPVGTAGAGSESGEEVPGRAAGPGELGAELGGSPGGAEGSGRESPVGEGPGVPAVLPALWLSVSQAAEAGAGPGDGSGSGPPSPGRGAVSSGGQEGAGGGPVPAAGTAERGGGWSAGGEGPFPVSPGRKAARGDLGGGRERGEGHQPAAAGVWEEVGSPPGAPERSKDRPVGGSPGAAGEGQRSAGPRGDVAKAGSVTVPLVQPQDGEETRF